VPETVRANAALWVPAILLINLQITTFFFVAGLMLLERDEGMLNALAVSPLSPSGYLAMRTVSLTGLAAAETIALVWIGFGTGDSWSLILLGTASLGVIYTGFGAAVATRYHSVNALLLPASAFVALLLLPLLPHFDLAPRLPFFVHPLEPPMTLIRAGYGAVDRLDVAFGVVGSFGWSAIAFVWGRNRVGALMRNTQASGGR
jgi:fluoroquinolone transport system permease protein